MLGNFNYYNPTKLYFGDDVPKNLSEELKNYEQGLGNEVIHTWYFCNVRSFMNLQTRLNNEISKI